MARDRTKPLTVQSDLLGRLWRIGEGIEENNDGAVENNNQDNVNVIDISDSDNDELKQKNGNDDGCDDEQDDEHDDNGNEECDSAGDCDQSVQEVRRLDLNENINNDRPSDITPPKPTIDESILALPNDHLRIKLMAIGKSPGPIGHTTRRVYERQWQSHRDVVKKTLDETIYSSLHSPIHTPTKSEAIFPVELSPHITKRSISVPRSLNKLTESPGPFVPSPRSLQRHRHRKNEDRSSPICTPIKSMVNSPIGTSPLVIHHSVSSPKYQPKSKESQVSPEICNTKNVSSPRKGIITPNKNLVALINTPTPAKNTPNASDTKYSEQLTEVLASLPPDNGQELEEEFIKYYSTFTGPKNYFNYILVDPRIARKSVHGGGGDGHGKETGDEHKKFKQFLDGIFYIGKGVKDRPRQHLKDAYLYDMSQLKKKIDAESDLNGGGDNQASGTKRKDRRKEERIIDIWNHDFGVVEFNFFQKQTENEALAREAFMIEAMKLTNLTNAVSGHKKKGKELLWSDIKTRKLGSFFLYKAFKLYEIEGGRQIKREDMKR